MLRLNKEDCFCSISKLYANIATKSGIDADTVATYDCTELEVSEQVFNSVRAYYMEAEGRSADEVGMMWLIFGPKYSSKLKDYEVEVFDGFFNFQLTSFNRYVIIIM